MDLTSRSEAGNGPLLEESIREFRDYGRILSVVINIKGHFVLTTKKKLF